MTFNKRINRLESGLNDPTSPNDEVVWIDTENDTIKRYNKETSSWVTISSTEGGNGGGEPANTGDIIFDGTTISAPNEQRINIDAKDVSGDVNARLRLSPEDGIARLQASYEFSNYFDSFDWESATVSGDEFSNKTLLITEPSEGLVAFYQSQSWNNSSRQSVSWNGGDKFEIEGSAMEGSIAFYLPVNAPVNAEVTDIRFYNRLTSRVEIDMYDDEEISIRGNGIDVEISSTDDVEIFAEDSLELNASEELVLFSGNITRLESQNNIVISSFSGGEYLNNGDNPDNQIATIGDIPTGATGSFTTVDNKSVTVTDGIITAIENI